MIRRRARQPLFLGLEALRDLVPMQPRLAQPLVKGFADVLAQIAARLAGLLERPDPTGRSPTSLMWIRPRPRTSRDQVVRHVAANREVHMQPVPARMPLGSPRIGQRDATKAAAKLTEEARHMPPNLNRIVAPLARVTSAFRSD